MRKLTNVTVTKHNKGTEWELRFHFDKDCYDVWFHNDMVAKGIIQQINGGLVAKLINDWLVTKEDKE